MSTEQPVVAPPSADAELPKYRMTISLNVLNHLGLYLYSNTPAVLSEVIANAWDADAKKVTVDFNLDVKTITITDDGHGMSQQDINDKYLYVGFEKRADGGGLTPAGRPPMGRKGIGKLSLFSIANEFAVFSRKKGCEEQALLMDAEALKRAIQQDNPSAPGVYKPDSIPFDANIEEYGTSIRIRQLKKVRLTRGAIAALRKRIARRFAICGGMRDFRIVVDGEEVTVADRDYFHKARFLFQYGYYDYAQHCSNLDADEDGGAKLAFSRTFRFDAQGNARADGEYEVKGWIGIARYSNDLDSQGKDDNLNKITVVVRGKVALEDILQEFRLGGMITKYIYGEINADFLDEDDRDDIATSSRQSLSVDDPRYIALRSFVDGELRHIWNRTNQLKDRKGLEQALSSQSLHTRVVRGSPSPLSEELGEKNFRYHRQSERGRGAQAGAVRGRHLGVREAEDEPRLGQVGNGRCGALGLLPGLSRRRGLHRGSEVFRDRSRTTGCNPQIPRQSGRGCA